MVSEAHLLHELVLRDGDGRVLRHRVAQRRHLLHREPDGRKREHHRRRLEALFQIIDLQQLALLQGHAPERRRGPSAHHDHLRNSDTSVDSNSPPLLW